MCQILIDFVINEKGTAEDESKAIKNKEKLRRWINQASRGEEGFTALHFASFHGNLKIINILIANGANVFAVNKQEINLLHVAA